MNERAPSGLERAKFHPLSLADLSLEDLEGVRLLLRGGSIVDWQNLEFREHLDVDRFLQTNEFDPQSSADMDRLEAIRCEAVEYLSENFDLSIPPHVAEEIAARDLFLVSSRRGRGQMWACVILKVMHIIHHLAGRDLLNRLAISSEDIYHLTELKVMQTVEELKAAGHPIVEFQWSRKPRNSLITKLLAKRSTLAANIYDKLRFRLVVRERPDILPVLAALTRHLIPFNYVIPGESVNHLISFRDLVKQCDTLRDLETKSPDDKQLEQSQNQAALAPLNEFSAEGYKIINFVADLPLRVDDHVDEKPSPYGNTVFVMTEFQIVDSVTAKQNEVGDGNHDAYKQRQYQSVRKRLLRGRRAPRYTGETIDDD